MLWFVFKHSAKYLILHTLACVRLQYMPIYQIVLFPLQIVWCYKVYVNFRQIVELGFFQPKWLSLIENILDSGLSLV